MLILLTKAKDCILISSAMLGQTSDVLPIRHIPRQPGQDFVMAQALMKRIRYSFADMHYAAWPSTIRALPAVAGQDRIEADGVLLQTCNLQFDPSP